jgi:transposase
MEAVPRLTASEWQLIKPILPTGRAMRQRHADRSVINALLYAEALKISVEQVPAAYGVAAWSLRTRRSRWQAAGVWPEILNRGAPAIERMRSEIGADCILAEAARIFGWDKL